MCADPYGGAWHTRPRRGPGACVAALMPAALAHAAFSCRFVPSIFSSTFSKPLDQSQCAVGARPSALLTSAPDQGWRPSKGTSQRCFSEAPLGTLTGLAFCRRPELGRSSLASSLC